MAVCGTCKGSGRTNQSSGSGKSKVRFQGPCPTCNASGKVSDGIYATGGGRGGGKGGSARAQTAAG